MKTSQDLSSSLTQQYYLCTQHSDISDSNHRSARQGFIMFGTNTLKLPFASGKIPPPRFPIIRCACKTRGSRRKHLSDLANHSLCSQLGIFFPTVSLLFPFSKMVASADWTVRSRNGFIEDSKRETSSVFSDFKHNLSEYPILK